MSGGGADARAAARDERAQMRMPGEIGHCEVVGRIRTCAPLPPVGTVLGNWVFSQRYRPPRQEYQPSDVSTGFEPCSRVPHPLLTGSASNGLVLAANLPAYNFR
ncbi:hypothetical protein GCM10009753_51500 [Streptantibioticus ferralitis]